MVGLQKINDVDIVNRSSSDNIFIAILGVIIKFLVGRIRKPNTRTLSKAQRFLNFSPG